MGIRLTTTRWMLAAVVTAAVAIGADYLLEPVAGGALIIVTTLFLGLAEGAVCLMAGAELSDGHWHRPLLPRAASLVYVIPVGALLFVGGIIPQLSIYPWAEDPSGWLSKNVFIARHVILLAVVFLIARKFVLEAMRGGQRKGFWAVIYVLSFVIHLSVIGIEWYMTIERPWFSTLFGAFVMVSAFLSGICALNLIVFGWRRRADAPAKLIQKSLGGLMFGFATFWAYFYFSQLIVIWYGNLPEETMYLAKRIGYHTPYWLPARLVFTMVWVVPFAVLLRRKNKTIAAVMSGLALEVLAGITMLFWIMLAPVTTVSIPLMVILIALLGFLTASIVRSYDLLLRVPAEVPVEAGAHQAAHSH
ncbi:MAG TPA: hypothetical protein VFU38_09810 [Candidatus Krumholzibacteria bacterium]|nr:hypothetical protein [Candidatus Krumholzibacteria bacterium]